MKIEPVFDSNGLMVNVSKTLLCDNHKPADARPFQPMIDNSIDNDGRPPAPERVRKHPVPSGLHRGRGRARKSHCRTNSEERSSTPVREVPALPPKRYDCNICGVNLKKELNIVVLIDVRCS